MAEIRGESVPSSRICSSVQANLSEITRSVDSKRRTLSLQRVNFLRRFDYAKQRQSRSTVSVPERECRFAALSCSAVTKSLLEFQNNNFVTNFSLDFPENSLENARSNVSQGKFSSIPVNQSPLSVHFFCLFIFLASNVVIGQCLTRSYSTFGWSNVAVSSSSSSFLALFNFNREKNYDKSVVRQFR